MKIYHNSRCRKSRETLSILKEHNVNFDVIEYLKHPLTKLDIQDILKKLNIPVTDLIRKEEKVYKELYKNKNLTESEYINILIEHPILLQRPIVLKDNIGVIGRPPINVLDLLNN